MVRINPANGVVLGKTNLPGCTPNLLSGDTSKLLVFCKENPGPLYQVRFTDGSIASHQSITLPSVAVGYDGALIWSVRPDGLIYRW